MRTLVDAYFNKQLDNGISSVIANLLGYKVRDWFLITDAVRNGRPIPSGMAELATTLDNLIGIDELVALEDTFNSNIPLLDKVRNVLRRTSPDT